MKMSVCITVYSFTSSAPYLVRDSDRSENAILIWLLTSDYYQAMI